MQHVRERETQLDAQSQSAISYPMVQSNIRAILTKVETLMLDWIVNDGIAHYDCGHGIDSEALSRHAVQYRSRTK